MKTDHLHYYFSKTWVQIVFIGIVTLLVYFGSFSVPFQFDDLIQIRDNSLVHNLDNFKNSAIWLNINHRPLAQFSLALNYTVGKESVFGYHLFNIFVHILTSIVVLLFVRLIVSKEEVNETRFTQFFPFIVALLFAVHVVQTQAVTYIVQRMTSMAALFFVTSVWLYLKARITFFQKGNSYTYVLKLVLAMFSGVLGILSKQNVIVFPLAILLVEVFFVRNSAGKICRKYIFTFSGLLVAVIAAYLLKFGLPFETKEVTRTNYLFTQFFVIIRYFQMMLVPFGLAIDHGFNFANGFFEFKVVVGFLINLAVITSAFVFYPKNKLYSFGVFWIYITLLVESSVIPIRDPMFEHRMYLPMVGFSISFFAVIHRVVKRTEIQRFIVIVILSGLSVATIVRNLQWNDGVALWKQVTEMYPEHERGWIGLAYSYNWEDRRHIGEVISSYEKALEINPKNEKTMYDLFMICIATEHVERAVKYANILVFSSNEEHRIQAMNYLGEHLSREGKNEEAEKYFEKVLQYSLTLNELDPEYKRAYYFMGKVSFSKGEWNTAMAYFEDYLKLDPNNVEILMLNSSAFINLGKYQKAVDNLQKAYQLTKDKKMLNYINQIQDGYLTNQDE